MFKGESGSSRFSSITAAGAPSGQRSTDRAATRATTPGQIGFVGLGRMGTAMAKNLAAAGHRVIACVRRPQQMGTLLALGLKPTTDLADLFDCEIVISMLPDDAAVCEVALGGQGRKGLAAGLRPGAIHLSMSTISTAAASQLASAHARCGQGYVAAPVFGNPDAAKARQLFIVAAGAPGDVERCRPLLDQLGQQTFVVGSDPAHANLIKLMGNMMTATALEMLGETLALIRKRGIDPGRFAIKLALATSSCLSQIAWVSRKLAASCLLSSRSSASMSRGVTKSASLSKTRCRRPMWPIERRVVPPILRTRSAMASVVAKICSPWSSRRRW